MWKVLDTCHYCFSFVTVVSAMCPKLPSHRRLSLWWVNSATFDPWRTATRRLWHSSPAALLFHPRGRSLSVTACAYVCVRLLLWWPKYYELTVDVLMFDRHQFCNTSALHTDNHLTSEYLYKHSQFIIFRPPWDGKTVKNHKTIL